MAASRVLVVASLAVAVAGSARADDGRAEPAPDDLFNGPSLHETGRIAGTGLETPRAATTAIAAEPEMTDSRERAVGAAAAAAAAPPPRRTGTMDPVLLDEEIAAQLPALDDCRVEVARRRRVTPAEVQGDHLLLRWTIRPNGTVTTTEVVAVSPVDGDLGDCVKAAMSQWTFARPRGGPLPVERAFEFREAD